MRRWKTVNNGGIVFENVQTGDGRVWAEGAWQWEKPEDIPVQWSPTDNGSHEDTLTVGVITELARVDNRIEASGTLDDQSLAGAEVARLMALVPPLASGVSVVYDDVTLEIVDTTGGAGDGEEDVVIMASASLRLDHLGTHVLDAPPHIARLLAAAGDPNPDGEVLMQDSADAIIYRYTRSRLRALTLVDVPAFIDARIELGEEVVEEGAPVEAPPIAASAGAFPLAPPRDWFFTPEPEDTSDEWVLQPDGVSWAVPLTILDSGQFYGHACYFGQCHVGYLDDCVSPPLSSDEWLASVRETDAAGVVTDGFFTGHTLCASGDDVPTSPVVLDADHPDQWLFAPDAVDAYAHTGLAWGDCRVTQSPVGVWVCGAVRPDISPEQLRVLRASSLSGDWRSVPGYNGAQFIAALTVSRPGFPIARHALAASGITSMPSARPFVQYDQDGVIVRASALNVVRHLCPGCAEREAGLLTAVQDGRLDAVLHVLGLLERRTRHLAPDAHRAALARLADDQQMQDWQLEAWRAGRADLAS